MNQSTNLHLARRLYIYQKERFPVLVHGLLIASFSFSAIGFSRLCRAERGFIPWRHYLACVFTNLTIFFLLRVADEYKDQKEDAIHRQYLPVQRGIISLTQLRNTAALMLLAALAINIIWFPALLPLLGAALAYLLLMRYEFGIGRWLNAHMGWYMISHMFIIPIADTYASGYDWRLAGAAPPVGLAFFFGVSYLNGMVLEMGRKLRPPHTEEPGVQTYTKLWGLRRAPAIWLAVLSGNLLLALFAAHYSGADVVVFAALGVLYLLTALPGLLFFTNATAARGKWVEGMSLLWALGMYLGLGGIPQLWSALFSKGI